MRLPISISKTTLWRKGRRNLAQMEHHVGDAPGIGSMWHMKSKRVTSNKCCTWRFITSNVRLTMLVIQSTFRTLSTVSAAPYFWYHNEKNNKFEGRCFSVVETGGSPHLSCKRDQDKIRDYMDWWVTPHWGPLHLCKKALNSFSLPAKNPSISAAC